MGRDDHSTSAGVRSSVPR